MADYSIEKGFTIQTLSSDPKLQAAQAGTWASGGNMNTARTGTASGNSAPGHDAGLTFAGFPPGTVDSDKTEKYDGTSWTEVADLNTGRGQLNGCGIQTAALAIGGERVTSPTGNKANTESWDGTSWTETGDLNLARRLGGSGGTTTAGIMFGGYNPGPSFEDETETFDGTSWTETADLNTGVAETSGGGTTTAALCAGGSSPSVIATVQSWDGTSWTDTTSMNAVRSGLILSGGASIQTAALVFGSSQTDVTESFNGTAWAAGNSTSHPHQEGAGSGASGTTALAMGGQSPVTDATEEFSTPSVVSVAQEGQVWYNSSAYSVKGFAAVGAGVWASGTAPPTATYGRGSAGTETAGLQFAGYNQATTAIAVTTETYNGSAWTEVADSSTGGSYCMGCGTQTAAFAAGASSPLSSALAQTWDGTSWTAGPAFLTQRYGGGGGGITTSAVYTGGWMAPGMSAKTEKWDGTSWTEVNTSNTARTYVYCSGSSDSDAMISGGSTPGSVSQAIVETYDGTSWTETTNLPETMKEGGGMGTGSTSAIVFGGITPATPLSPASRTWDGSAWTEVGALGTGRQTINQGGNTGATGALCLGGYPSPAANLTEEYTAGNAIKTFTSS